MRGNGEKKGVSVVAMVKGGVGVLAMARALWESCNGERIWAW